MDWRGSRGSKMTEETEDLLERENRDRTENLAHKVSRLKNIAFDIETETKDQNRYLTGLDSDFDSGKGLLMGSINRINHMIGSGKNNRKLMCYIALFFVVVFFVVYFILTRTHGGSEVTVTTGT